MFLKSFGCVFLLITNTKISYSQNDDKTLLEKVEDLFDDGEELMKKSVITLNEKSLLHYFELCNKFKSFSPFCFHVMQQKRRFWKLCLILTMFKFLFFSKSNQHSKSMLKGSSLENTSRRLKQLNQNLVEINLISPYEVCRNALKMFLEVFLVFHPWS